MQTHLISLLEIRSPPQRSPLVNTIPAIPYHPPLPIPFGNHLNANEDIHYHILWTLSPFTNFYRPRFVYQIFLAISYFTHSFSKQYVDIVPQIVSLLSPPPFHKAFTVVRKTMAELKNRDP